MNQIKLTLSIFRLPWNQHTFRGWIGETIFSVISSSLYLFTNVVFLTFFMACCEFHRALLNYFEVLLQRVRKAKDPREAKELLCDSIQFHVLAKK